MASSSLRILRPVSVLLLLSLVLLQYGSVPATAFVTPVRSLPLRSFATADSVDTGTSLPIIINGQNIPLTDALVDYVNKRIGNTLSKLMKSGAVRECDVILSVSKNPKVKNGHRVEVVTNLKGTTIICKNSSPDMYTSIDAASHALNRKLRTYKERRTEGWHGGAHMGDDLAAALAQADAINDTENGVDASVSDLFFDEATTAAAAGPTVTKVMSFQLDKAVSLEEAVFALDYVDHDFYVFRNEATNEINVVYKRHTGGVGLVEP